MGTCRSRSFWIRLAAVSVPLLAATPAVAAQLSLSWTDNATNETGFRIERRLSSSATFAEIATVGANVTAYVDTTVTSGQDYCYRVRAYNAAGTSDYTNVDCATVPATPPGTVALAVTKAGTGTGTITGPGINCGTDCSQSVTSGTSVTLTATPASGSTFVGWSGGGCSGTGSCTKNILVNTTVTATFTATSGSPQYTLTISKTGTGTGSVTGPGIACGTDCSQSIAKGTTVILTAVPTTDSLFDGWNGGGCSGTGTCSTMVRDDLTIKAKFKAKSSLPTYTLTVTKAGAGIGAVTGPGINCGTDCSQTVTSGTSVTLTANPAANSTFVGWSGGCSGTGSCTKTILANTTVTAKFSPSNRTLAVSITGEGTGTVTGPGINCGTDCARSFTDDTTVTLTAKPDDGSAFAGWSGACGGNGDCTVTVSANTVVGVMFRSTSASSIVEIVTGAEAGSPPRVRGLTRAGSPTITDFLAHAPSFTGGVFVALGRLDSEGTPLIATGSGPGIPAEVRAFRTDGSLAGASFHPYGPSFSGGTRVAMCDVDGNGSDEIVSVPGPGYAPLVAVWQLGDQATTRLLSFIAGGPASSNGLFVACGDVDGDGASEIVVGDDQGGAPEVRVYRVTENRAEMIASFVAYEPSFTGGVRVSTTDIDGDGLVEIITAPGPGGEPLVRAYTVSGDAVAELTAFHGEEPGFTGGLFVAGGKRDDLGGAAVMTSSGPGGAPHVRIFSVSPIAVIESTTATIGGPGVSQGFTLGASQ